MKIRIVYIILFFMASFAGPVSLTGRTVGSRSDSLSHGPGKLAIFFTNDIHSHAAPQRKGADMPSDGFIAGGYSRLASLLNYERRKADSLGYAVITVDAGDVVMGTVYQSLFTEDALDFRMLGMLRYDAYTLGNHDFDIGCSALSAMIRRACSSDEEKLPVILDANLAFLKVTGLSPDSRCDWHKTDIKPYTIINRKGLKIAVIGLMGDNAWSCITDQDSILFEKPHKALRRCFAELDSIGKMDYYILLSHGGIQEDIKTARKFSGRLNAIISGHDHVLHITPVNVGKTVIGGDGAMNRYLGEMEFTGDSLSGYHMLPLYSSVPEDSAVADSVSACFGRINKLYKKYGIDLNDTAAISTRSFFPDLKDSRAELGRMIAVSNAEAVKKYSFLKDTSDLVSVVPYGVIRGGINAGPVTYADLYDVLPLGYDETDGTFGYPIVLVWLTGSELEDISELDPTVSSYAPDVTLFFSGLSFKYDGYYPPFMRVRAVNVNGKPVDKNKLYPVVSGMYTAKLIRLLGKYSLGILSAVPKDSLGAPIDMTHIEDYIVKDGNTGVKEWIALSNAVRGGILEKNIPPASERKDNPWIWAVYVSIAFVIFLIIRIILRLRIRRP
ncbi:MAG: 5'-nucleotidase C-terminal domain-containing protein [Bacteroidales bacterium]|jgi:5'-nucleotidase|nr:5'-nucleotidase C-terminal domain-containing protein [Bacteroidales bacterium]